MIINYASSGINKLKASLNDDARLVIYNCHMFIVQATGDKIMAKILLINLIILIGALSPTRWHYQSHV